MFNDMRTAFIIPTAISQAQDSDQALQQCLHTIKSIQTISKQAGIGIVEYANQTMPAQAQEVLLDHISFIAAYQQDTKTQALAANLNPTQILALNHIAALTWFASVCETQNVFPESTQIIVIEPGMTIDATTFDQLQKSPQDKFIFAPPSKASLSSEQTGGIVLQLNTHLWAFSSDLLSDLVTILNKSVHYSYERLCQDGVADLSHTLFKYIHSSQLFFLKDLTARI